MWIEILDIDNNRQLLRMEDIARIKENGPGCIIIRNSPRTDVESCEKYSDIRDRILELTGQKTKEENNLGSQSNRFEKIEIL